METAYEQLARLEFLDPDPLAVAREHSDPADREVAGLAAACLALGSAPLIVRAARQILAPLGPRPAAALDVLEDDELSELLSGFRYRFFGGEDLAALLSAIRNARRAHGSLNALFRAEDEASEPTIVRGADRFVLTLEGLAGSRWPRPSGKPAWRDNLLPRPGRGSACKRLFLYLRWMIRKDAVDPGGWTGVSPARLVVPLDTHMGAACRRLGLLARRTDDLAAALELTEAFRRFRPDDPVRYDFALTRPGIHPCLNADSYFACFDRPDSA